MLLKNQSVEQTSETEMPTDWNFLAYSLLDLVELLVTKTSFLPYIQPTNNISATNPLSEFWN